MTPQDNKDARALAEKFVKDWQAYWPAEGISGITFSPEGHLIRNLSSLFEELLAARKMREAMIASAIESERAEVKRLRSALEWCLDHGESFIANKCREALELSEEK